MCKKIFSILLVVVLVFSLFTGCSDDKGKKDEKIVLEVGNWPTDVSPEEKARYEEIRVQFMKKYPDIEIVPSEWAFDVKSFLPQAASGQLPTLYKTYFTEVDRIVNAGYAADLTDVLKKYGYIDALSDGMKEIIERDGKYYMVPDSASIMGLAVNRNLFEKAGLVNEDGSLQIPQTYDELIETSKIIKEKTGAHGFGIATKGAGGGWHFINIAWSFGTKFMEKKDGKWVSTFGSQECADALKYLQDLKWKHQAIPNDVIMDGSDLNRLFATDKVAMMFTEHTGFSFVKNYAMSKEELAYGALPAGPKDRCTQVTGVLYCVANDATEEQKDAAIKWLNFTGDGPELTDDSRETIVSKYETHLELGYPVGILPYSTWKKGTEVRDFTEETILSKANIDLKFFKEYANFDALTIKPEEPVNCQELYQVLATCMQQVLSDKNADPLAIVKQASKDFQTNSLANAQ